MRKSILGGILCIAAVTIIGFGGCYQAKKTTTTAWNLSDQASTISGHHAKSVSFANSTPVPLQDVPPIARRATTATLPRFLLLRDADRLAGIRESNPMAFAMAPERPVMPAEILVNADSESSTASTVAVRASGITHEQPVLPNVARPTAEIASELVMQERKPIALISEGDGPELEALSVEPVDAGTQPLAEVLISMRNQKSTQADRASAAQTIVAKAATPATTPAVTVKPAPATQPAQEKSEAAVQGNADPLNAIVVELGWAEAKWVESIPDNVDRRRRLFTTP